MSLQQGHRLGRVKSQRRQGVRSRRNLITALSAARPKSFQLFPHRSCWSTRNPGQVTDVFTATTSSLKKT